VIHNTSNEYILTSLTFSGYFLFNFECCNFSFHFFRVTRMSTLKRPFTVKSGESSLFRRTLIAVQDGSWMPTQTSLTPRPDLSLSLHSPTLYSIFDRRFKFSLHRVRFYLQTPRLQCGSTCPKTNTVWLPSVVLREHPPPYL
jgi:hypothetical protein